jgi:hypothetical protein
MKAQISQRESEVESLLVVARALAHRVGLTLIRDEKGMVHQLSRRRRTPGAE